MVQKSIKPVQSPDSGKTIAGAVVDIEYHEATGPIENNTPGADRSDRGKCQE